MKRLLKVGIPIIVLLAVLWYLVLKNEDYQVSFTSQQPKNLVYQHILDWERYSTEENSVIVINDSKDSDEISQSYKIGDSTFLYQWRLISEGNKTRVTAHITDLNNSFKQRLQVPFLKNAFVKRSIKNVEEVGKAVAIKGKQFKIGSIESSTYEGSYCAYLPVTTTTEKKASAMLSTIAVIMKYLKGNDIELNGDPFLEVTAWDESNDEIQFNFCFPIIRQNNFPKHEEIQFKETKPFQGLRTTFNGNYRISHYGWYYLLDHAKREGISVKKLPLEIFLNDPHSGGNSIDWQAHIFLPLED